MIANILDGIVLGLQFGLLAAGLTLIYGLGGVLNLGYGQIAVTSAMTVALAMDAGFRATRPSAERSGPTARRAWRAAGKPRRRCR